MLPLSSKSKVLIIWTPPPKKKSLNAEIQHRVVIPRRKCFFKKTRMTFRTFVFQFKCSQNRLSAHLPPSLPFPLLCVSFFCAPPPSPPHAWTPLPSLLSPCGASLSFLSVLLVCGGRASPVLGRLFLFNQYALPVVILVFSSPVTQNSQMNFINVRMEQMLKVI